MNHHLHIIDNEHDPVQDSEHVTPGERRKLIAVYIGASLITLAWMAFLGWVIHIGYGHAR